MNSSEVAQQIDEDYDLTPGRYSEVFPSTFRFYFDRWMKYWPKTAVHVKRAYDGGFVQRKNKKGGNLVLFPELAVEWAERHLDHRQWAEWKVFEEPGREADHGEFWLGLHAPRKATVDCIDLDAKPHRLAYYRLREDAPVRPLVVPDLAHFRDLKAIYDRFPSRIWCISSATLGVHVWRRRRKPADTEATHAEVKSSLEGIGLGHVEVHPMKGRCLRRPFGQDYKTITPEGVLEGWAEQVEYFEHDARTPPFEQVVRAVVDEVRRQIVEYRDTTHQENRRPRREIDQWIEQRSREVVAWLNAGCPDQESGGETRPEPDEAILAPTPAPKTGASARTPPTPRIVPGSWAECLRDGRWAAGLAEIARDGLPEPDCVGPVLCELAKWLYWIELFEMPEGRRRDEARRLLTTFIRLKHNGFVTRLLGDDDEDVIRQLDRCIDSAIRLDSQERSSSLELFCRIRQKRSRGRYGHVINIALDLEGRPPMTLPSPPLRLLISVSLRMIRSPRNWRPSSSGSPSGKVTGGGAASTPSSGSPDAS